MTRNGSQSIAAPPPPPVAQPNDVAQRWEAWLGGQINAVIGAMPMNVPEAELKRARAQMRVAFTKSRASVAIYECTPDSIAECIVLSAVTGLMPGGNAPDIDIIPRRNRKKPGNPMELCWQISYRGYIRLARRNPGWDLQPFVIYDGDEFDEGIKNGQPWMHYKRCHQVPLGDPKAAWEGIRYAFPLITLPSGATRWSVLDKSQLEARRACAQTQEFWGKWPIEMVMKTACRFAGQRELFPTDDPIRYALLVDTQEVKPTVVAAPVPAAAALPPGLDGMERMLPQPAAQESAPPAPQAPHQAHPPDDTQAHPAEAVPEISQAVRLTDAQVEELEKLCNDAEPHVSLQSVEEQLGAPLPKLVGDEGEDNEALNLRVRKCIQGFKKKAAASAEPKMTAGAEPKASA